MKKYSTLVFFCLEIDNRSKLLKSNIDLLRAFAESFAEIIVVATHIGEIPKDLENIRFVNIGGGSTKARIRAIFRLFSVTLKEILVRRDILVFHHMSHRTVVFPGIVLKLFGIFQILWYSHHAKPFGLFIATRITDAIVTPSRFSFPIKSNKVHHIGQAIETKAIPRDFRLTRYKRRYEIITVGRVSRAKSLEKFAEISLQSSWQRKLSLINVGQIQDAEYLKFLKSKIDLAGHHLELADPLPRDKIFRLFLQYCFYFSGTPRGVDRAAIEAAISGCLVLTENPGLLELTGMQEFWVDEGYQSTPILSEQYEYLSNLTFRQLSLVARKISKTTSLRNNVRDKVREIGLLPHKIQ